MADLCGGHPADVLIASPPGSEGTHRARAPGLGRGALLATGQAGQRMMLPGKPPGWRPSAEEALGGQERGYLCVPSGMRACPW